MNKLLKKRKTKQPQPQGRITNETVAEHRERILAGGRKFKYPVQYTRHRLIFNTIIIIVVAFVAFLTITWWQLYQAQTTNAFFYRTVRIVPVPVASVDGYPVRYGDYLTLYRPVEHFIRENGQLAQATKDQERQLNLYKRSVLDQAEANAYAEKLAGERDISVSDADINEVVLKGRQASNGSISQELYDASLLETLGFSREEYRLLIKQSLLYKKVVYAVDEKAKQTAESLKAEVKADSDFAKLVETIGNGAQVGSSGDFVQKTTPDGGLALAAFGLEKGQISDVITSTNSDGYYIVRLDDKDGDKVRYSYIKVPLTEFQDAMNKLRESGKIKEYIEIPEVTAEVE